MKKGQGGRPSKPLTERRVMQIGVRFDIAMLRQIDEFCRLADFTRPQMVRAAVRDYLAANLKKTGKAA